MTVVHGDGVGEKVCLPRRVPYGLQTLSQTRVEWERRIQRGARSDVGCALVSKKRTPYAPGSDCCTAGEASAEDACSVGGSEIFVRLVVFVRFAGDYKGVREGKPEREDEGARCMQSKRQGKRVCVVRNRNHFERRRRGGK